MIAFTQLPPDEEAKVLSVMTLEERIEYRKRQFAHRLAITRDLQLQEWQAKQQQIIAAKIERAKNQQKRQAANRAAKIAKDQAICNSRSGRNAK